MRENLHLSIQWELNAFMQFINALLGADCGRKMRVDENPERACTTSVDHIVMDPVRLDDSTQKHYRLALVDTPGLDTHNRPDSKVYGQIADWSNSGCVRLSVIPGVEDKT